MKCKYCNREALTYLCPVHRRELTNLKLKYPNKHEYKNALRRRRYKLIKGKVRTYNYNSEDSYDRQYKKQKVKEQLLELKNYMKAIRGKVNEP